MMNKDTYIYELSDTKQTLFKSIIQEKLLRNGFDNESDELENTLDNGMNSRVSNLDELLDEHEISMILELSDNTEMQMITEDAAKRIIDTQEPQGLFYTEYEDSYVAIDNSTGEAYTEEFKSLHECVRYLNGEDLAWIYVGDKDVYLIEDDTLDVEVDYEDYYKSPEYTANEVAKFIEENDLYPLSKRNEAVIVPIESDGFIVTSDGELFTIVSDFVESNKNNQPKKVKDNGMEI